MKREISTRLQICVYIAEFYQNNGFAPSYRQIMDVVKLASVSTVHGHINRLKRDGYITSIPELPRTIVPKQKLYDFVKTSATSKVEKPFHSRSNEKVPEDYSDRLVSIRKAKRMSREELAFRSGVSYGTLCAHERGVRIPRIATYKKYMLALSGKNADSSVS